LAILGLGVDLVEVERFESVSKRFLERVYTKDELSYAFKNKFPAQSLAARFAAKEAVIKAFGWRLFGQELKEIAVKKDKVGKPLIELTGKARSKADRCGAKKILLSFTHTKTMALAEVIVLGGEKDETSL